MENFFTISSGAYNIGLDEDLIKDFLPHCDGVKIKKEYIYNSFPRHSVTCSDFYISKKMVTRNDFQDFVDEQWQTVCLVPANVEILINFPTLGIPIKVLDCLQCHFHRRYRCFQFVGDIADKFIFNLHQPPIVQHVFIDQVKSGDNQEKQD